MLTCLLAAVSWVWLPSDPESAWFLSEQEKDWVAERVLTPNSGADKRPTGITWQDVVETARDWKLWFVLIFNICASVPATAFSVFLPLVVQGMGYSSIEANLVSHRNRRTWDGALGLPVKLGCCHGPTWSVLLTTQRAWGGTLPLALRNRCLSRRPSAGPVVSTCLR